MIIKCLRSLSISSRVSVGAAPTSRTGKAYLPITGSHRDQFRRVSLEIRRRDLYRLAFVHRLDFVEPRRVRGSPPRSAPST
jgi:hypothetical protein